MAGDTVGLLASLAAPAVVAAAVTAAATHVVDVPHKQAEDARRCRRAIVAIYAEMRTDLHDLTTLAAATDLKARCGALQIQARPLHLTDTRTTRLTDRNPAGTLDLPTEGLVPVIGLDELLEGIESQLEGLNAATFTLIARAGQAVTTNALAADIAKAVRIGGHAVFLMETRLPATWFNDAVEVGIRKREASDHGT